MPSGDFIYPPILNSSQPAYDYNSENLIINFTIPEMVNVNNIGLIGITIVNQSNNISIVNSDLNDDILYFDFDNCIKLDNITNTYAIKINQIDYLQHSKSKYSPGKIYKVQMNFGKGELWTELQVYKDIEAYNNLYDSYDKPLNDEQVAILQNKARVIMAEYSLVENQHYTYSTNQNRFIFKQTAIVTEFWKEQTAFSEWSSVMLIKPITIPELTIGLPNERGALADKFKNISEIAVEVIYVERSLNPLFIGTCVFTNPNENEVEDQYKFFLYENSQLISETDWLTHKTNETSDQYSFDQMLKENIHYSVDYQIKTNNGYISDIKTKSFIIELPDQGKLEGLSLRTEPFAEDGYMNVYLNSTKEIQSNFILSRAAENTNFQKWEDLGYITNYLKPGEQLVYKDYTVESGVKYLYALTEEIRYDNYSEYKSPLYEGENGEIDTSKAKSVDFEYAFLYSKGKQLKLKFNNKMSSFKKSVLASKQDTIGSQYPTILRNGLAYYAEFPIAGLISLQMDDNQTFFTLEEEGYYYNDELIIPKDKLQNINYRESTNTDQSCSPWTSTDLVDDNIFIERRFREKVEEFLNDGECKLYRSPTEGNFIINLLNISFTPNQTLGRMIYEFNSTAYEIDEVNIKNLEKLDILNKASYVQNLYYTRIEKITKNTIKNFNSPNISQIEIKVDDNIYPAAIVIDMNQNKKNQYLLYQNDTLVIPIANSSNFFIQSITSNIIVTITYKVVSNNINNNKIKNYISIEKSYSANNLTYFSRQIVYNAVESIITLLNNNTKFSSLQKALDYLNTDTNFRITRPDGKYYTKKTQDSENPEAIYLADDQLTPYIQYFNFLNQKEEAIEIIGKSLETNSNIFKYTIPSLSYYSTFNPSINLMPVFTFSDTPSLAGIKYKILLMIEEV